MVSAKFEELYKKTREIKAGPSNEDQLNLYAWAKIAQGEDISTRSRPGMFNIVARTSHDHWQKVVDQDKLTPQQAEEKYIALAQQLVDKYLN